MAVVDYERERAEAAKAEVQALSEQMITACEAQLGAADSVVVATQYPKRFRGRYTMTGVERIVDPAADTAVEGIKVIPDVDQPDRSFYGHYEIYPHTTPVWVDSDGSRQAVSANEGTRGELTDHAMPTTRVLRGVVEDLQAGQPFDASTEVMVNNRIVKQGSIRALGERQLTRLVDRAFRLIEVKVK